MESADFGKLSICRITETDFDDIMKFLRADFLLNEPLNRSINLTAEDADGLFGNIVHSGIASSLSYALRKSDDGQIVALRLVTILDRLEKEQFNKDGGAPSWKSNAMYDNNITVATKTSKLSVKAQLITNILEELHSKIWILTKPQVKRLLYWSIISVDQNFTRRGLAGKLLNYNLDEAKLMGCQGCITEASALRSQQLFKKLGYETLHEVKHDKWLDETGKQIFRCDDGTTSVQLFYKPL